MKKLLVLFVIASLTTMAYGTMSMNISVGGSTTVEEIDNVTPSTHLVLDITNTGDFNQPAEAFYFGLIADDTYGAINGGAADMNFAPSASSLDEDPLNHADLEAIYGDHGIYGFIGSWNTGTYAGGVYFRDIDFHCVDEGDVTIYLISTGVGMDEWHVLDSVLVHQIPEPATIALLCLGGLLLRKK